MNFWVISLPTPSAGYRAKQVSSGSDLPSSLHELILITNLRERWETLQNVGSDSNEPLSGSEYSLAELHDSRQRSRFSPQNAGNSCIDSPLNACLNPCGTTICTLQRWLQSYVTWTMSSRKCTIQCLAWFNWRNAKCNQTFSRQPWFQGSRKLKSETHVVLTRYASARFDGAACRSMAVSSQLRSKGWLSNTMPAGDLR